MKTIIKFSALILLTFSYLGCELADVDDARFMADDEVGAEPTNGNENTNTNTNENGGDQIDLQRVSWLDTDVSGWPITTSLDLSLGGGTIRMSNDKEREWPPVMQSRAGDDINANAWIFVNVDGTWYGATWEWLVVGAHSKPTAWLTGRDGHISSPPLNTWDPVSGETYGFMVSTPARGGTRSVNERSNVVLATWP